MTGLQHGCTQMHAGIYSPCFLLSANFCGVVSTEITCRSNRVGGAVVSFAHQLLGKTAPSQRNKSLLAACLGIGFTPGKTYFQILWLDFLLLLSQLVKQHLKNGNFRIKVACQTSRLQNNAVQICLFVSAL